MIGALLLSACTFTPAPQPSPTVASQSTPILIPDSGPTPTPMPTFTPVVTPAPVVIAPDPEIESTLPAATPQASQNSGFVHVLVPAPTATRLIPTPYPTATRPAVRETHVPILMFHHIAVPPPNADPIRLDLSVWPDNFEAMMAGFAAQGYHSVKLIDVYDAVTKGTQLPRNPIVFTFDDGYDDNFTNALPILKKYNFTGTFYIPSGLVEQPGYMTWAQVVAMSEDGMEIESHTISHPSLKGKPADFVRREVTVSKQSLEMMIGKPVLFFCYPSGQYDAQTIALLQAAGYLSATTTAPGAWQNAALPFEWPRVRIHGGNQAGEVLRLVKMYVGGYY